MALLTPALRAQLPPLGSQADEGEPMVYACFYIPDAAWLYFVTEGSPEHDGYRLFGFLLEGTDGEHWRWCSFLLSELEAKRSKGGATVLRFEHFVAGPLTDAIPLPLDAGPDSDPDEPG